MVCALGACCGQAAAQEVGNGSYRIQKNDTLIEIASRYETSVEELVRLNKISKPRAIQPGQVLAVPKRYTEYTVKNGDTLSEIAAAKKVSIDGIKSLNGISNPKLLKLGQELKIPLPGSASSGGSVSRSAGPPRPQLAPDVRAQLAKRGVHSRWKYIVIHHSATAQGSMEGMDRYHRDERKMQNGLAYHFVIGNGRGMGDGQVGIGSRWRGQLNGGHLYAEWQNSVAIGICLVGNFEERAPTAKQQESLVALLDYLQKRTGLGKKSIMPHRKINVRPTVCPGKYFPQERILSRLR